MIEAFKRMKKENGYFVYADREYVLIQQAYLDDYRTEPCYRAMCICPSDLPDEDGFYPVYVAIWDIREGYSPYMQEDMACDWENPREIIIDRGGYRPIIKRK